jgi:transcriptional regulator with XRE-family HTH domain
MAHSHPASYLRSHRKRSGLSQKEVASLLGYKHEGEISRHERLLSAPPFHVALAYEALYRVPVAQIFPGIYESRKEEVETRLAKLVGVLHQCTASGREAAMIARKLEWVWERVNQDHASLFAENGRT